MKVSPKSISLFRKTSHRSNSRQIFPRDDVFFLFIQKLVVCILQTSWHVVSFALEQCWWCRSERKNTRSPARQRRCDAERVCIPYRQQLSASKLREAEEAAAAAWKTRTHRLRLVVYAFYSLRAGRFIRFKQLISARGKFQRAHIPEESRGLGRSLANGKYKCLARDESISRKVLAASAAFFDVCTLWECMLDFQLLAPRAF